MCFANNSVEGHVDSISCKQLLKSGFELAIHMMLGHVYVCTVLLCSVHMAENVHVWN
jgi:hypothetical protein